MKPLSVAPSATTLFIAALIPHTLCWMIVCDTDLNFDPCSLLSSARWLKVALIGSCVVSCPSTAVLQTNVPAAVFAAPPACKCGIRAAKSPPGGADRTAFRIRKAATGPSAGLLGPRQHHYLLLASSSQRLLSAAGLTSPRPPRPRQKRYRALERGGRSGADLLPRANLCNYVKARAAWANLFCILAGTCRPLGRSLNTA